MHNRFKEFATPRRRKGFGRLSRREVSLELRHEKIQAARILQRYRDRCRGTRSTWEPPGTWREETRSDRRRPSMRRNVVSDDRSPRSSRGCCEKSCGSRRKGGKREREERSRRGLAWPAAGAAEFASGRRGRASLRQARQSGRQVCTDARRPS